MVANLTSRRNWIISGLMMWASMRLPAGTLADSVTPQWLAPLLNNLKGLTSWIRTEFDRNGDAVIHCGAKDLSAWARRAGGLAGNREKVRARGNILTFAHSGRQVRIVLHPESA